MQNAIQMITMHMSICVISISIYVLSISNTHLGREKKICFKSNQIKLTKCFEQCIFHSYFAQKQDLNCNSSEKIFF